MNVTQMTLFKWVLVVDEKFDFNLKAPFLWDNYKMLLCLDVCTYETANIINSSHEITWSSQFSW